MLFYEISARKSSKDSFKGDEWKSKMRECAEGMHKEYDEDVFLFVHNVSEFVVKLALAVRPERASGLDIEMLVEKLNLEMETDLTVKKITEIRVSEFKRYLSRANGNDYIDDNDAIEELYKIDTYDTIHDSVVEKITRTKAIEISKELLYDKTFVPEIERICNMGNPAGRITHPVHYIIKSDDNEDCNEIINALISALYDNKRLCSKRFSRIYMSSVSRRREIRECYQQQRGGTVVLHIGKVEDDDDSDDYNSMSNLIQAAGNQIDSFKRDTLTIAVMPINCETEKEILLGSSDAVYIEISPENAVGEAAKRYLAYKAKKVGCEASDELFEGIDEEKAFCRSELREKFDKWHTGYLIHNVYPMYKGFEQVQKLKPEDNFGRALKTLDSMIGLDSAKKVIYSALDFYKVQKMYYAFGKKTENVSMHMVFTGNPGTAKTTVARLFAQILKDNGVIKNGKLVEVGRADLVGKYVGHTAPKVKDAFEKAKGGVLFIDEAYSLLDDRNNMYGDEAINTIVQEMENNRNDTIVIFAGYPKEMEQFLSRNPGLRSRIAFHVPFEDYSADELFAISKLMAKNKENVIHPDCEDKLKKIFDSAAKTTDFGNGRFVRNVMEQAEMNRASRLAKLDYKLVTREIVETFVPEDFEYVKGDKRTRRSIGF